MSHSACNTFAETCLEIPEGYLRSYDGLLENNSKENSNYKHKEVCCSIIQAERTAF